MTNGSYPYKLLDRPIINIYGPVPAPCELDRRIFHLKPKKVTNSLNAKLEVENIITNLSLIIKDSEKTNPNLYDKKFNTALKGITDKKLKKDYQTRYTNLRNLVST